MTSKRWLGLTVSLMCTLALLTPVSFGSTWAWFSDTGTVDGNTFSVWTSRLWTVTTEAEFQSSIDAGLSEHVSSVASAPPPEGNGDVVLEGAATGSITDEFLDYNLIDTDLSYNVIVISGQVQLNSAGDTLSEYAPPTNDTSTVNLSRNAENRNYKCVDDTPPGSWDGDTTYVYDSTPGDFTTDIYQVGFSPNGDVTRVTVHIVARAVSDDPDDIAYARTALRTSPTGTIYYGDAVPLTTTYQTYSTSYYLNPDTSIPWTQGAVQSLLAGVSLQSTATNEARCTQMYIEVVYGEGGFLSPGELYSENLLAGISNNSIDSFTYYAPSVPAGTTLRVQFSTDGVTWYDSGGTLNGWDTMSEGTHTIDLTGLGWSGPNFYYRVEFTTDDDSYTPILDYVTVNYSTSYLTGWIASQVFDTTILDASWDALVWDETLVAGTDITFEVRASDTPFLADDAAPTWIDVGGTSGAPTNPLPDGQYKQWRATLTTTNPNDTPILHEVRVYYDP